MLNVNENVLLLIRKENYRLTERPAYQQEKNIQSSRNIVF